LWELGIVSGEEARSRKERFALIIKSKTNNSKNCKFQQNTQLKQANTLQTNQTNGFVITKLSRRNTTFL